VIVKFSTRRGQLTMLGEPAVALLRGMGHSGTVPGAILSADLPAALGSLERMLETQGDSTGMSPPAATDNMEDEREREPVITLRTRAVPLIDMLRTAIAGDSDLMWERT
jgi:hypothetical protein